MKVVIKFAWFAKTFQIQYIMSVLADLTRIWGL